MEPQFQPKWSTRWLESVKVSKRRDFTDPEVEGLTFRVMPTGAKSWRLLYRRKSDGKKRPYTIGRYPAVGWADARTKARELKVEIEKGGDPAADRAAYKQAQTVSDLLDLYLKRHPRREAAWTKNVERMFNKDVRPEIGDVKLPDLRRGHIRQVIDRVVNRGGGVTVNKTHAGLRRALSWGVENDYLASNPALSISTSVEEKSKDRALNAGEIKAFWDGLVKAKMSESARLALRLTLVTGQRPGEVCGARQAELNLDERTWSIPSSRAKNRTPHLVPLSVTAIDLFKQALDRAGRSEFVFPSMPRSRSSKIVSQPLASHALSHALRDCLEAVGLSKNPATPHDLRRTAATQMAELGIPDRIVGRVLNHGTELRRTITAKVYIKHDYAEEKRRALEAWGARLSEITSDKKAASNIVDLKRA